MAEDKSKSLDILGVKPIADAVNTVTKGMVEGAAAILSRICLPAAEELGFLLQDKVRVFRAKNAAAVVLKAQEKLEATPGGERLHALPRLVGLILEQGSWVELDAVQNMWAGLLATSCTEDGQDDSNLMFADLLSRLTASQCRILDFACREAKKTVAPNGLLVVDLGDALWSPNGMIGGLGTVMSLEQLYKVSGTTDLHRLDRELDHLRSLELILPHGGGFSTDSPETTANVTPTSLAIQMFVRLNGFRGDPTEFFGLTPPEPSSAEDTPQ